MGTVELGEGTNGVDPAVAEHDDAVGELEGRASIDSPDPRPPPMMRCCVVRCAADQPMFETGSAYITWRPHSVLSRPAQRPERGSSGSSVGWVQGMQPMER